MQHTTGNPVLRRLPTTNAARNAAARALGTRDSRAAGFDFLAAAHEARHDFPLTAALYAAAASAAFDAAGMSAEAWAAASVSTDIAAELAQTDASLVTGALTSGHAERH